MEMEVDRNTIEMEMEEGGRSSDEWTGGSRGGRAATPEYGYLKAAC